MIIKLWAKSWNINDAKYSTLSSYTLTLMVLSYLQCGTNPPVLPALHQMNPHLFNNNSNLFQLPFKRESLPQFQSQNWQSLASLVLGFFQFYNNFDFMAFCGSVRTGTLLRIDDCYNYSKELRDNPRQWEAYICMEEPFGRSNTGRAVIKRDKFDEILYALRATHYKIAKYPCLECLWNSCRNTNHN